VILCVVQRSFTWFSEIKSGSSIGITLVLESLSSFHNPFLLMVLLRSYIFQHIFCLESIFGPV
jgi:hypothetical protein